MSDRSFYQWLMTQRKPEFADEIQQFANNAFMDQSFPKHTRDYQTISNYLEERVTYLPTMSIFDDAYEQFKDIEHL
ncbi:MAG: YozE family protein [Lactobacillaceae bacterium]|jgi:uncharacterized protein YozE (UPF0346 family)|nr:YozE family protein [Lactobacillaceae bacterium]